VAALLSRTDQVFSNVLVGGPTGIHMGAIHRFGELALELARATENGMGNFRLAAMANVEPDTPYFPASYNRSGEGFSLALELAPLAMRAFSEAGSVQQRLERFGDSAGALARRVAKAAREVEAATGVMLRGIDFSLAPYPSEESSVVAALEMLNGGKINDPGFILTLYAVNQVLKSIAPELPRVGYNGSMLSVLEDQTLAARLDENACTINDLLLCSTVCGCGLDMLPVTMDSTPSQIAALVESVAAIAHKWSKPLIARVLPAPTGEDGRTAFRHDFIVNARPLTLPPARQHSSPAWQDFIAPAKAAAAPSRAGASALAG
jgi:uncharacterized protein (UPF0210 family)